MAREKTYTTRRHLDLPTADLEWYEKAYPKFPLAALITMLLHEYRSIHRDIGMTPQKVARDAAREVKSVINDELEVEVNSE